MSSEDDTWISMTVGDLVTLNYGESLPERKRKQGKIPVYGSNGITGYHDQALVSGPGIIVGRKGTSGAVHYCKSDYFSIDTTFYITPSENYDLRFVYYLLQTLELDKLNFDSAVPGLNRNTAYSIPIKIPQKQEQQKIASILGALDDKIELNHQMNRTLEEMAQAIFKSWFVDFEFPNEEGQPYKSSGGEMGYSEELQKEIPKGWGVKPIDETADFLNGLALQKYPPKDENYLPVIKIRELRQGITESSDKASPDIDKRYIVNDGDILFSWSGSLEVCIWCGGKGALNQHLFKVTSQTYPKWFFYHWIKFYLPKFQHIAKGKATTMGHIQRHHLSETCVLIPPKETIEKMNEIMNPLIEKFINNNLESRQLVNLRDALLPKLLSGEIRMNNGAKTGGGD
jgi:type I restriction enzyme S subunit